MIDYKMSRKWNFQAEEQRHATYADPESNRLTAKPWRGRLLSKLHFLLLVLR